MKSQSGVIKESFSFSSFSFGTEFLHRNQRTGGGGRKCSRRCLHDHRVNLKQQRPQAPLCGWLVGCQEENEWGNVCKLCLELVLLPLLVVVVVLLGSQTCQGRSSRSACRFSGPLIA